MEETNRPAPATGETAKNENHTGGSSHGHGHRGHRGGRRHSDAARQNRENAARNGGAPQENNALAGNAPAGASNAPAQNAQNPQNQQNPQGGGRRNRHRGGHRGGNNQNNPNNQGNPEVQSAEKAQTSGERPANGNDRSNNARADRRHDRRGNQRPGPDRIQRVDDIYGNPQEKKELAELRAKIVLKNAEGVSPVLPTLQPAVSRPAEENNEPVEIPEGIDVLHSTILDSPKKDTEGMTEVIGIRFRPGGKMYYFDPAGKKLRLGDCAVLETARGPEFGEVCLANTMVKLDNSVLPLRPLLRIATAEDIAHNEENRRREAEALPICQKKIEEHGLDMKLVDVQYIFDNSRLLFYFSSEGRVDFRDLVRDLASVFRTRIELRQIGIRDEAKMLGGFGACGRPLCCSTFLPDFAQVSIKMAKEQNLSLNSAKISGLCGRLMCCLHYEADTYAAEIRLTPPNDSTVRTPDGVGTVIGSNPLAGTVRVLIKEADSENTTVKQFHRNDVVVLGKERRDGAKQEPAKAPAAPAPEKKPEETAAPEPAEAGAPEAEKDGNAE